MWKVHFIDWRDTKMAETNGFSILRLQPFLNYPLWDEVTFIDRHKVVYFKTIFHFQVMFGLNRDKNNQLFYFYFAMGLPYILYCLHNDRNKIVYFKTVFLFPVLCDAKIELK